MSKYTTYVDIGEPATVKATVATLIRGTGFLRDNGMFRDMVKLIDRATPPYMSVSVRDLGRHSTDGARGYAIERHGFDPRISVVMWCRRGFDDPDGERQSMTLMAKTLNVLLRELKEDIYVSVEPSSAFYDLLLRKGSDEILMDPDPDNTGMWDTASADFKYRPHKFPL